MLDMLSGLLRYEVSLLPALGLVCHTPGGGLNRDEQPRLVRRPGWAFCLHYIANLV
jgi:hypothetical protein